MIAVLNVLFHMLNSNTSSIRTSVVHAISVQLNNHVARTNVQMINYGTVPHDCSSPCMGVVSLYTIQQSATTIGPDSTAQFTINSLPYWHYIEGTAYESMIMSSGALSTPIKDNEHNLIDKQVQPENTLSNSATDKTYIC